MNVVNLVIVFSERKDYVLMCKRMKDPYEGLLNFVGGKAYPDENGLEAAYRELSEETGIQKDRIELNPLFSTVYMKDNLELQVYYGVLEGPVTLIDEVNPLVWISVNESFIDQTRFAGDGNILHMMQCLKAYTVY